MGLINEDNVIKAFAYASGENKEQAVRVMETAIGCSQPNIFNHVILEEGFGKDPNKNKNIYSIHYATELFVSAKIVFEVSKLKP